MDYPRMLCRPGTALRWNGRDLDLRTVHDAEEEQAARREGWRGMMEAERHPLDHDGDGKPGGSLPGEQSTRRRGRPRKVTE